MLKLIKGNQQSLEGKALIYCTSLNPDKENEKYPSMFVAPNCLDLAEVMRLPITEEIHRVNEQTEKMFRDAIERSKAHGDAQKVYMPLHACEVFLTDLDIISLVPGDVVSGGEAYHLGIARRLLIGLSNVYMAHYTTQLESRLNTPATNTTVKESFREFDVSELRRRLYDYSGRLVTAVDQEDGKEQENIKRSLRNFTQGANFFSDIINLVGVAQTRTPQRLDLLARYVDKICAVYEEDFRTAARLKQEIESLSE